MVFKTSDEENMASNIIRVLKRDTYTSIDNRLLRDTRLSFAARGLMGYLLSKPNDWQVRVEDLIKQSPAGRDAVYSLLTELSQFKYVARIKRKAERGHFQYETVVSEVPLTDAEIEQLSRQIPLTGQPEVETPSTARPEAAPPKVAKPDAKEIKSNERSSNKLKSKVTLRQEARAARLANPVQKRDYDAIIKEVWDDWVETFKDKLDTNQYKLTKGRKRMMRDRLDFGWTKQDLHDGLKGLRLSKWHMAQHPENRETLYLEPKYAFQDDETLEKRIFAYRAWLKTQPCQFCNDTGFVVRPVQAPENTTAVPQDVWSRALSEIAARLTNQPVVEADPQTPIIWNAVLDIIRPKISPEPFATWFGPLSCLAVDHLAKRVVVRAPNQVVEQWIQTNYAGLIEQSLAEAQLKGYTFDWYLPETKEKPVALTCLGVNCNAVYLKTTPEVKNSLSGKRAILEEVITKHFGKPFEVKYLIEQKMVCAH